jgi:hypothetical protein
MRYQNQNDIIENQIVDPVNLSKISLIYIRSKHFCRVNLTIFDRQHHIIFFTKSTFTSTVMVLLDLKKTTGLSVVFDIFWFFVTTTQHFFGFLGTVRNFLQYRYPKNPKKLFIWVFETTTQHFLV